MLPHTLFLTTTKETTAKLLAFDGSLHVFTRDGPRNRNDGQSEAGTMFATFKYYKIILDRLRFQTELLEVRVIAMIAARGPTPPTSSLLLSPPIPSPPT